MVNSHHVTIVVISHLTVARSLALIPGTVLQRENKCISSDSNVPTATHLQIYSFRRMAIEQKLRPTGRRQAKVETIHRLSPVEDVG
jgi:hypothetical protein